MLLFQYITSFIPVLFLGSFWGAPHPDTSVPAGPLTDLSRPFKPGQMVYCYPGRLLPVTSGILKILLIIHSAAMPRSVCSWRYRQSPDLDTNSCNSICYVSALAVDYNLRSALGRLPSSQSPPTPPGQLFNTCPDCCTSPACPGRHRE